MRAAKDFVPLFLPQTVGGSRDLGNNLLCSLNDVLR